MVTSIFERRVRTCDGQRESCSRFSICFVLMTAMGLLEAITLAFSMATAGIGQTYVGDVGDGDGDGDVGCRLYQA